MTDLRPNYVKTTANQVHRSGDARWPGAQGLD